ncbi:MAG: lipase secretion chaperone [Burkholderiaceae bacterium]
MNLRGQRRTAVLVALLAAGLLLAWFGPGSGLRFGDAAPAAPDARPGLLGAWDANPFASGVPSARANQQAASSLRELEAVRRVADALQRGSLQGTVLDGSWGTWSAGQLQPSLALRQRFDYLLTLHGEVTPAELRYWLAQQARMDVGSEHASQVLALWDQYLALQQSTGLGSANLNDPAAAQRAAAERAQLRRSLLGPQWAEAFYAEEEQALKALLERRAAGSQAGSEGVEASARSAAQNKPPAGFIPSQGALLVPPSEGLTPAQASDLQAQRVAQFGPEAAQRLREEDALRLQWEQRLAQARQQVQTLARAPELSALQRQAAQEAALAAQFSGSDLLRARALLLTPP